jgi:hypothetical protein
MTNSEKHLVDFLQFVDDNTYLADGQRCFGNINKPIDTPITNQSLATLYLNSLELGTYTIQELIDMGSLPD